MLDLAATRRSAWPNTHDLNSTLAPHRPKDGSAASTQAQGMIAFTAHAEKASFGRKWLEFDGLRPAVKVSHKAIASQPALILAPAAFVGPVEPA
jgi:hypothetical protein